MTLAESRSNDVRVSKEKEKMEMGANSAQEEIGKRRKKTVNKSKKS